MKLRKPITVTAHPDWPWIRILAFRYSKPFIEDLRSIAGARWNPHLRAWTFPVDCLDLLTDIATQHDYAILDRADHSISHSLAIALSTEDFDGLYLYQADALRQCATDHCRVISFDTGLGKTAVSVRFMRAMYRENQRYRTSTRVLIIAPASVRANWTREIEVWWPDCPIPVTMISASIDWADIYLSQSADRIVITSYDLPPQPYPEAWDLIVLDETHYLSNTLSARTERVTEVREACLGACVIGLTGTPIRDRPQDAFGLLSVIWPLRWGSYWQFVSRYCVVTLGEYGREIGDLNSQHEHELRARLDSCLTRVTRTEVSHLLPPLAIVKVDLDPPPAVLDFARRMTEVGDEVGDEPITTEPTATELRNLAELELTTIVDATVAFALDKIAGGQRKLVVLTHLRRTAHAIGKQLCDRIPTVTITGDIPTARRDKLLVAARDSEESCVVATMHSVGVGIDTLATYPCVIYAELSHALEQMTQSLGRFGRLSSHEPTTVYLMTMRGTSGPRIADALASKVESAGRLVIPSTTQGTLTDAITPTGQAWLDKLAEVAASMDDDF